jgi:hypothetical protein
LDFDDLDGGSQPDTSEDPGTGADPDGDATDPGTDVTEPDSGSPDPGTDVTEPDSDSATPAPDEDAGPGPGVVDECARPVGSGAAPVVEVTDIDVGAPVVGYGSESDTDPLPMAISAAPSGGSWLAWLGTDDQVHVGRLDCNDELTGSPVSFPAIDLQDIHADEDGGVVLLTREGECGGGKLCGGTSSPCRTMHMVRFDNSGNQVWERQVTNLTDDLTGYDDGARFVWWYQHHGRLAYDGSNYAAYFGVAITVNNGGCVDIHQGDRMQVVDADGSLVSGHPDAFEVGCSHSWGTRIVWDDRTERFVTVCATDNECRIATPNPYQTVARGECDGTLFGGDLVLASTEGYWTAWSQGGEVRLEHFTDGPSDKTIETGAPSSHPHLVSFGEGQMLLSWESGSSMAAQVYDAGSGQTSGDQFAIDAKDHDFQAFKAYPDGSAAYPAAGDTDTTIRIARVMPWSK